MLVKGLFTTEMKNENVIKPTLESLSELTRDVSNVSSLVWWQSKELA